MIINNQQVTTKFYIVKAASMEAIMGIVILSQLGPLIHPVTGSVLGVEKEQPAIALPVIRGHQHKIVLKDDVTLICHNPLPTIAELHAKLHGVVFSQVDLQSGYHQLALVFFSLKGYHLVWLLQGQHSRSSWISCWLTFLAAKTT